MYTLLSILTASSLALAALAAPSGQDVTKRDILDDLDTIFDFNVTVNNNGGVVTSAMPVVCIQGCTPSLSLIGQCLGQSNTTACESLCADKSYQSYIECNDCVISNGVDQAAAESDLNELLGAVNQYCSSNFDGWATKVETKSLDVGSATTNGPYTYSYTGATGILPTWTGFKAFPQESPNTSGTTVNQSPTGSTAGPLSGSMTIVTSASAPPSSTSSPAATASLTPSGAALAGMMVDPKLGVLWMGMALLGFFLA